MVDCLFSRFVSLRIVGREGLENMARFSLFLRRSFDDAGDVTRGRLAVPWSVNVKVSQCFERTEVSVVGDWVQGGVSVCLEAGFR